MKEEYRWKMVAALGLIALSLALYTLHFLLFHDAQHILIYSLGDLAFVPIEILVVTLIIDQMLESRERQRRLEKLNMVIGIFFSRFGTPVLGTLSRADPKIDTLRAALADTGEWQMNVASPAFGGFASHECNVAIERIDLVSLRDLLVSQEDFLLRLVENPMVFEHETFTNLILAVDHLTEELKARGDLASLPKTDRKHLSGDMQRVYSHLVPEWIKYMEYLRTHYPYLFSLALRRNPFDEKAEVVLR
ncbi:MAG: hypothetical protein METHP_01830 [Methanoregula sp. SKADARSKE-2]|nr:MAG: hypothetical protein METHP_01830 [Methanoregula sp. SKADARSKE-2]